MFKAFLAKLGSVFASISKDIAKAALYISAHPDVVKKVESIAVSVGAPADKVAIVDSYATKAGQVASSVRDIVDAPKQ